MNCKQIFALTFLLFQIGLQAQNEVSGTISIDSLWTLDQSPYRVVNNLTVDDGATLTIEPGVVVEFVNSRNTFFTVNGTLIAQGTSDDPIVFTSVVEFEVDGSLSPGLWRSITFNETSGSSSILDFCEIRYGGRNYFDNTKAVRIVNSSPTITNSTFFQNDRSMVIEGSNSAPTISDNIFQDDTWAPIMMDLGSEPIFSGNQFLNCTYNAIGISDKTYDDDDFILPKRDVAGFTNIAYVTSGNITLGALATLTIDPGVVIKGTNFRNSSWIFDGTLLAQGTQAEPIVWTSIYDDTFGGDTNNDADATTPAHGQWRALTFRDDEEIIDDPELPDDIILTRNTSSNSILDFCEIRYGGYDYFDNTKAIRMINSSPTITNSHFYQNSISMVIEGASTPILDNNVFEEDIWAPIMMDLGAGPLFSNNQYVNNRYDAIGITDKTYTASNYTLSKQDIAGIQDITYITSGNIAITDTTTLTIDPGVIIKATNFRNSIWTINGTLLAQGTATEPVVFTSIYDDTFGGDTNNDVDATTPSAAQWRSITFTESSGNSSIMDFCEILYGGYDYFDNTKAIRIINSSPTITNTNFYNNSISMVIEGSSSAPTISDNTFEEDTWAPIMMDLGAMPIYSNNQFVNNTYNAIGITDKTYNEASYTLPTLDIAGISNVTYITLGNIAIGENTSLTIDPGVVIKATNFRNSYWTINGTLIAQGTETDPIVFTSLYDDTFGGDTNNDADATTPAPAQWRAIQFTETSSSSSILDHCEIRYGGHDYFDNTKAIRIINSSPTITNNNFFQNSIAMVIEGTSATPTISDNIFEEDSWAPIMMDLGAMPSFMNNQYVNNTYNAIGISEKTYTEASYTLPKQDIAGIQNVAYITTGNIAITDTTTLTIEPGVVIKATNFRNSYWTINGTLIAQGTEAEPIVFTSLYDDANGGDTNNDADATTPAPAQWRSIIFSESSGSSSIMDHCLISYGGHDYFDNTKAVTINNSSPTITNNTFFNNSIAINISGLSANPIIADNTFEEDTYAPVAIDLGVMPDFTNNTYVNCVYNAIAINSGNYTETAYTLVKQDIADFSNVAYIIGADLTIADGSSLTIEPGVVIKFVDLNDSYVNINGTLIAQGTSDEPIVFTEIDDDNFGGDTNNNGDATVPEVRNWQGIRFFETSGNTSIIDQCVIHYGGWSGDEAIEIINSSPTITNNDFFKNGVSVNVRGINASPMITDNTFREDTYAPIIMDLGTTPTFSDNVYTNNTYNAIGINAGTYSETSYTLGKQDIAGFNDVSYIINADLTIGASTTLTIDPGVVIKFVDLNDSYVRINGTLVAQGTEAEPIIFTEIDDDEYGGDTNNNGDATAPAVRNWQGFIIAESSGSTTVIDHCQFRYGGWSTDEAIMIVNSEPVISNNLFYRNGIGISINGYENQPQINNNIFEEDTFAPIQVSLGAAPAFTNNTYTNNTYDAISILTQTYTQSTYQLSRRNVAGIQNIPYIIGGNMTLSAGSTWTIDPGVVIKFTDANDSYMTINGTLIAQGIASDPIIFTEIDDDTFGGDTNNNGGATNPAASAWEGFAFSASSGNSSVIDFCHFSYGGWSDREVLMLFGSNPSITNSTFLNNSGAIRVSSTSDLTLDQNIFEGNSFGIQNQLTGGTLTIENSNFIGNQKGILNESSLLVVNNSSLLDNTVYDIENLDPEDVQAQNNWWGEDDFELMELNDPALNFPFIYDQLDEASRGLVLYYPPKLPDTVAMPENIPDLEIYNVFSGITNAEPGDVVTVTWDLTNIGEGFALVDWTEKVYIQAPDGTNRVLVGQVNSVADDSLLTNEILNHSLEVTLPNPINVGDMGVFAVEVVPTANVGEPVLLEGNNTAVEDQTWSVDANLVLEIIDTEINEGGAAVSATITRNGSTDANLIVDITPTDPFRFTYPSQVTILAGQGGQNFTIAAIDNGDLEGPLEIEVAASSAGFETSLDTLILIDDEIPELSIDNLPATIEEGELLTFDISTNFPPADTLFVNVLSSDPIDIPLETPVKILPGETTVSISVMLPDNDIAEENEIITITAGSAGLISATEMINLIDENDIPAISFAITIDTVSESAGIFATEGVITRLGNLDAVLNVDIAADVSGALYLPSTVPLGPGQMEERFDIGVLDNGTVDGFRDITVTASVIIEDCNCTAPGTSAGVFSDVLTIADNDGPSLSLQVNPLSLAEGMTDAGVLTVTRNTPTDVDLIVTLSSGDETEIILPATVTIPIGSSSINVPINTIQDDIMDGNQQVTLQANATNYSPGIAYAIVTDVNKPDLEIVDVSLPENAVPALQNFQYRYSISNTGLANAPIGANIKVYLSVDLIIDDDDLLISDYCIPNAVFKNDSLEIFEFATAPEEAGNYYMIIIVNGEQTMTEIQYFNNTSEPIPILILPDYFGTAVVDEDLFLQGEEVIISGTSIDEDGAIVPNVALEVYIINDMFRRELDVTTDENGTYSTVFNPLPNEGGHYIVGASYPDINSTELQDEFDILGIALNNNEEIRWEFLLGDTLEGSIQVTNLSDFPLNNISIVPTIFPEGASIVIDNIPFLGPGETLGVAYEVSGTEVTPGLQLQTVILSISSDENIAQDLDAYYLCQAQAGLIRTSIASIDRTISQDQSNFLEFKIFNEGLGESGDITVDIPGVDFMSLVSLEVIPSIESGDTSLVIIEFLPAATLPLNTPATGTIVISALNSNFIVMPYTVQKVSDLTGSVIIDAVDQYTYFTEESPHVANASVKITNYFTGEVFAEGTTDANGLFPAANLPEGLLRVVVQADQHAGYDGTINVLPGMEITETVFLSYQAISFSWDVVPTTVEDEYQVDLIMEFETNVPMPVVTIDAPKELPELFGNDTYNFNVTMVNEGLITARDVELNLPSDPEYEFITNYVPTDLLAQQAIQVPVIMRRKSGAGVADDSKFQDTDDVSDFFGTTNRIKNMGLNCVDVFAVAYWYECGPNGVWQYAGQSTVFLGRFCSSPGTWNPVGRPCGNCPPAGTLNPTPVASNYDCNDANILPCALDILGAALGCSPEPYVAIIGCGISIGTFLADPSWSGAATTAIGCLSRTPPIGCIAGIAGAINTCFLGLPFDEKDPGTRLKNLEDELANSGLSPILQQAILDIEQVGNGYAAHESLFIEMVGETLYNNENILAFTPLIAPYVEQEIEITAADAANIIAGVDGFDIPLDEMNAFFDRYNLSIEAFNNGVLSPNATYPDIIDQVLIDEHYAGMVAANDYALNRGFSSIVDMHDQTQQTIADQRENDDSSVCASVTIQISQEVTMTREAFEGTLGVLNGHPTDMIDSLELNLEIVNPQGVLSNDLFQIELIGLDNLSAIDGTGTLTAQEEGTATILFIPEKGAAPTVPVSYSFGGSISYKDPFSGLIVTVPLFPVTLQVNPSPDLYLHYFMDRDLLGDDALTDAIEPIVPGELAVMIENNGYGTAMGVNIESAQPEIIDNEKGLAISFSLIGTQLQGEEANMGISNIDFGDIDPLSTKVGQWFFTSTLLGHFINYETNLVHLSSFGNPDLSLISGVELHELIQTISVYSQDDGIDDFLINDIQDPEERPDQIYLSQGNIVYDVYEAEDGFFTGDLLAAGNTNTLHVDPSATGWNYIKLDDPGDGNFEILSVTRSDGQEIPLKNAWLTFVTIPDSKEPIYENKFHIVDEFAGFDEVTYTVVWSGKDPNPPFVSNISGFPSNVTTEQVETLTVTFSEEIQESTFGIEDLNLIVQGGSNIIDNSVTITRLDDVTYEVDISAVSTPNGFYVFTVQTTGINDATGTAGVVGEQISWTQFLTVPSVVQFIGLPDNNIGNEFDTVQMLFNMPLDFATVTPDRFTIALDGVPQTGTFSVTSLNAQNTLIELVGIGTHLSDDGVYELIVDLPNIQSTDGMFGIATQSVFFTLDTGAPSLMNLLRFIGGGLDDQHYTGVNMNFSEDIMDLDVNSLSLTKDGTLVDISEVPVDVVSVADWFAIESFEQLTYDEGDYVFSIDMSTVSDLAGNFGTGIEQTSWSVDRTNDITISGLTIDPDLGFSPTDGITSTLDLTVGFTINNDAETVNIYQDDNGTLTLLETISPVMAGNTTVPVEFMTGGNTALLVEAIDETELAVTEGLDLYLDETSLTANWDFEEGQVLAGHPTVITLIFSDPLLNDESLDDVLFLDYENNILSTADLVVTQISDTEYEITGLENSILLDGVYTLSVDIAELYKFQSGLRGTDISSVSWGIETAADNELVISIIDFVEFCLPGTGTEEFAQLAATATGGSGMYTFNWSNDLGMGPIKEVNPTETTVYSVTVSDNFSGSSDIADVTVSVVNCTGEIVCSVVEFTDVTCNALSDGTITVNIAPGDQFEFSIDPDLGTNNQDGTFTNLPAGTYNISAFSEFETMAICEEVTIGEPDAIICSLDLACQEEVVHTGYWSTETSTMFTSVMSDAIGIQIETVNEENSVLVVQIEEESFTNANPSWFSENLSGAPASRFYFVWDLVNEDEDVPVDNSDDSDASVITITFDQPVSDPVIHVDRLGGATTTGKSNSSMWTLLSGGSLEKLSGTSSLIVNGDSFHREISPGGVLLNPEAHSNPNNGTAAGSIKVNTGGPVSSISFQLTALGYEGTGGDAFEMIISTDECIDGSQAGSNVVYVSESGAADGMFQVNATGGTGQLSFSISPNLGTNDGNGLFTNLPVGNYTVQITDSSQCTVDCEIVSVLDPNANTFQCESTPTSDADVCLDEHITMYANPVSGQYQIKGLLENYDIEVLNADGTVHEIMNTNNNYRMIDVNAMPNGLYFISIRHQTNQTVQMEKIIKN